MDLSKVDHFLILFMKENKHDALVPMLSFI